VLTTVDETTTTFTGVDIGLPHPDRVVVAAIFKGGTNNASGTLNGVDGWRINNTAAHEWDILTFKYPFPDITATLVVNVTSSIRKAVSIYVAYPGDPIETDSGSATANTTTNANIANLEVWNGGCLIYCGGQAATLGTFTTTWTGPDAVVEDVDSQLETAASYTAGHINITRSSTQDDLDLAESTSGTKRLWAVCLKPPRV
jgi:hypothetical protein